MEKIRKAQLTGYRRPKDVEIQVIYQYLRKELGRADKRLRRTAAFLGAAAGVLLFAAAGRMAGAASNLGETVVTGIAALLLLWGCICVNGARNRNRRLLGCVRDGNFDVMDCVSERFDTDIERSGKGAVQIRDREGNLCVDYFLVDYGTASQYRGMTQKRLLLVYQKECGYYRIFTDVMLNMR